MNRAISAGFSASKSTIFQQPFKRCPIAVTGSWLVSFTARPTDTESLRAAMFIA